MKHFFAFSIMVVGLLLGSPVFAADSPPPLYISAVNAGYKDDDSAQNYDFIELARSGADVLSLGDFSLRYFNSSGNLAGTLTFAENLLLQADRLVLGFQKSPQYADFANTPYVYYFSSSGLASTAGAIQLWLGEDMIDEVCWGKAECIHQLPKFATSVDANTSYVRNEAGIFEPEIYHPEINSQAILELIDDTPSPCADLIITEIYSYYIDAVEEQFIELYNPTSDTIPLDLCQIRYKNDIYPLAGELAPEQYFVFRNASLALTKNPSTFGTINILNASGDILSDTVYPHGQKKGTSYALFEPGSIDEKWLQTYQPTPGAENSYQQFQTCPADKEINPETGNCVKSKEEEAATTCPEGKYLNPLTGRCKNIVATTTKFCKDGYHLNILTGRCNKDKTAASTSECKEGYERNPDTGRCRKVRTNTAQEYPVTPTTEEQYDSPQIFIASGAIIALLAGGAAFAVFQFRKEIKTGILKICRRKGS